MNSVRCFHCGLSNWSTTQSCKRCGGELSAADASSKFIPAGSSSKASASFSKKWLGTWSNSPPWNGCQILRLCILPGSGSPTRLDGILTRAATRRNFQEVYTSVITPDRRPPHKSAARRFTGVRRDCSRPGLDGKSRRLPGTIESVWFTPYCRPARLNVSSCRERQSQH